MLMINQLIGFGSASSGGNDNFTKVLLHMDGTDASTTFTDENAGGSAKTWTANGNAQIDTGIFKFGTAAGLFDGTGDYVSTPDHADFTLGTGDFTFDLWFNRAGGDGTDRRICGQCNSAVTLTTISFDIILVAANTIAAGVYESSTGNYVNGTTTYTATGWHHMAFVRTGNTLKLFLDGVQEGGDVSFSGTVNNSANAVSLGRLGEFNGTYWNGSIDEFRLSVGKARWVSNFTPPTSPYRR